MWNKILFIAKAYVLRLKFRPNTKFVRVLNLRIKESLVVKYGRSAPVLSPAFRFSAAFSAVVIMFVSSAGVYAQSSPAVNETHPLYPLKRNIENVREIVALTPKKRAEVRMDKAEERLKEAEQLEKKDIVAVQALKDASKDVREAVKLTRSIDKERDVKNIAEKADKLDARRADRIEKILTKDSAKTRPGIKDIVSEDDVDDFVDELSDESTVEELNVVEHGVERRFKLMKKMMDQGGSDLTD